MSQPARQKSFLSRFRSRRTLSRRQLAAIHAKREGLMGRLGTYQQGLERIAEVPAEQGAVKFVGKYGRAQRGRAVNQGTVLDKQRRAIGFQIQKAGRELEKVDEQIRRHETVRAKQIALASAGLGTAAAGAFLFATPLGRRLGAKGLANFRPLGFAKPVLAHGKEELAKTFAGQAEEYGRRVARGAEGVVRGGFGRLRGSFVELDDGPLVYRPGLLDPLDIAVRRGAYRVGRVLRLDMIEPPRHASELARERARQMYMKSVSDPRELRAAMTGMPDEFGLLPGGKRMKGRMGEMVGPNVRAERSVLSPRGTATGTARPRISEPRPYVENYPAETMERLFQAGYLRTRGAGLEWAPGKSWRPGQFLPKAERRAPKRSRTVAAQRQRAREPMSEEAKAAELDKLRKLYPEWFER